MAEKHLTELAWKTLSKKQSVKESDLSKALARYAACKPDDLDGRLKTLGEVKKEATSLKAEHKKNKEVADYLDDIIEEADSTLKSVEEQKKAPKAPAGEELDLAGGLAKVKSGQELPFAVCVGRPYAVAVATQITGKDREALKAINKGTTFITGTCVFEQNAHTFVVPRVQTGLAKKLRVALAAQTGKTYKVRVRGTEDGQVLDDATDRDPDEAASLAGDTARVGDLSAWTKVRTDIVNRLRTIAKDIAGVDHPQAPKAILELNAVIRQLTPEPATRAQIVELERYLGQDDVVIDVCKLDFDMRTPLLDALGALRQQLPA
jgi:hypothetical protein